MPDALYPGDAHQLGDAFGGAAADDGAEIRDKYGLTRIPASMNGVPCGVHFFTSFPSLEATGDQLLALLDPAECERVNAAWLARVKRYAARTGASIGTILLPELREDDEDEAAALSRCGLTLAGAARLLARSRQVPSAPGS